MQFRFDANQDFQVQAVSAVADLFDGQPRSEGLLRFKGRTVNVAAVPNSLDIDEPTLLANLHAVQERNGIKPDKQLELIEGVIQAAEGDKKASFPNFSVEMETGTGKTYVYIRTALELYRRYGFRKYIVVVPSVAIREGVLKTLAITQPHFRELYRNVPYHYYAYTSASLTQVRQFALSNGVEIMIMTLDSFNKDLNVIRQTTDRLQGETPIHLVQAARPILILDEPQNMESEKSVAALSVLDPLFAMRYSATHRNPYNLVYRLTPYEAYRQRLVKRIEVASVLETDDENLPFIRLDAISSKKHTITARLTVHSLMKDGTIKEQAVTVIPGENLEDVTNRPEYGSYDIEEINPAAQALVFGNGKQLKVGASLGADKVALFEAQIRYTIKEHFLKQARLRESGIKVLSLFFIDRVDNYAAQDGLIRKIFDSAFEELKREHGDWQGRKAEEVQAAYFAQSRKRTGEMVLEDSSTGKSRKDEESYNLIMKDKERLLSFDEPRAFIFSHSALREGWDNPNVCQICTLNQTASEVKKRQEVGRGMRLVVNQAGERVHDEAVNVLTVVANESYEHYVERLQSETAEEYGVEGLPPKPANARKPAVARLRKEWTLKPEFKELWKRIRQKTRYAVNIDSGKLVEEVLTDLDRVKIPLPRVSITKVQLAVASDDTYDAHLSGVGTPILLVGRFPLPNLVALMEHLMEQTSPAMRVTRATLLEIIGKTQNRQAAVKNPQAFAGEAVSIIKTKLAELLVRGIQYEKIDAYYEMSQLETDIRGWRDCMVPAERSLYDRVSFESEVEKRFVEELDRRDDVKLYVKLPGWFTVDTPVGQYNPDWAIVMEKRDEHGDMREVLYLVRETKSTEDMDKLHPNEKRKITCGERHFDTLGVDYRVVTSAKDLP